MRNFLLLCMAALCCLACNDSKIVTVTVTNPLAMDRSDEMVEVSMTEISNLLNLADTAQIVVLNVEGEQVPYQVTYDDKLIFPATVAANASAAYTVQAGTPVDVEVRACGRQYPERLDDMAWENDLVGFRAYGPALQARGERGFGYDLFTKRGTAAPVLEDMYAKELDADSWKQVNELRKTDPKAADELVRTFSYHIDHGYGMDCYAVGPTLGAGVSALKGDTAVVETRLITLDAGSHLNRTAVSYSNLKESLPIVTGIVLHEPDGAVVADAAGGYMTYVDPTTGPDNGKIFMGAAFPAVVKEAKTVLFPIEEKKMRNNADGHVLVVSDYEPGADYVYYWGFAWDRADIKTAEAWNRYMADFAQKVRNPMTVSIR